jgi:SPP1 gp7 family putative phage head morphogenesis protein
MPHYPKGIEDELHRFIKYMIDKISHKFKQQVIYGLQVATVKKFNATNAYYFVDSSGAFKFTDKQVGNYSVVYLKLVKKLKKKVLKQFSNENIDKFTNGVLKKVNKYNQRKTYRDIEKNFSIDMKQLVAKEAMQPDINALMRQTSQWGQRLRDETLQDFTANTLRSMSLGNTVDGIIAEFDKNVHKKKNSAKFVARNQVSNFNGILSKIRHQRIGIKRAIWLTSEDEKVRECHRVRNLKEFDLADGLYSSCDKKNLFPGTDYNCRCIYIAIIPEFEETKDV